LLWSLEGFINTESRQSIIKEVGVWFEDLSKEFSDDATFGFVIRGMITRLKQGEIPPRKLSKIATTPLRKDLGEVFKQLDEIRGYKPPKRPAEASSILRMLKKGFTPQQIIDTWKTMKADKFYYDKELFMMSVESQIGAMVNKNNAPKRDTNKYFSGDYGHMVQK
jgi:hypothetical protein